jgi:tetratricopeptide (TPR) repeat protein
MKHFTLFIMILTGLSATAAGPAVKGLSPSQSANDFFQQGFDAASNGQYDVAVQNYTSAIERDPNRIYFYYHRGLAYKALHEKPQAIADFKQCISMRPIAEAYYEIGIYKYDELDMATAKQYFEQARELKDNLDKLNYYLGVINYRMNNYDTAEAQLTQYVHLVKTNSDAFLYLAMVKVKLHKYEEVTPMLQLTGLYNDGNDWKLHLKMYEIYKEMGDKENMFYHINLVIELGATRPEFYSIRAQLYLERGQTLRAGYDMEYATKGAATAATATKDK